MNIVLEKIFREVNNKRIDTSKEESNGPNLVKGLKEKTTEKIRKDNSNDNFMKFQWCWTL
jgi:hypothetical protein